MKKAGGLPVLINRVREYRVVRDITQKELASAVLITRQSLIAIEKQKFNPSLELALRLCKFFDCKVEDLFELVDVEEDQ
ncbi:helix-turn-helix transcriptional regulator [Priestia endophytica]|uniref:helix-turn-helix transcriptional regulator n=1 Tax=Priestia endophytica TaxID=135735 RepID=UPI003AF24A0A